MASKTKVKLILELRAAQMSQREISRTRKMSQHSVDDVYRIADKLDVTYDVKPTGCFTWINMRQRVSTRYRTITMSISSSRGLVSI